MENARIDNRVCVGDCMRGRLVIDRKRDLDIREARRLVHDRNKLRGFVRGGWLGVRSGDEPL